MEERNTLCQTSPENYHLDITGETGFQQIRNLLRVQKPNSGVFMVLSRPKKSYLLFGCAHQNSQAYDQKMLEDLAFLWKQWQEPLEKAVLQAAATGKSEAPLPYSAESAVTKIDVSLPSLKNTGPVLEIPETKRDDRRPVVLVDEVTRLFNKDYFSECLSIEVERAKRYSRLMSLMFLSVSPVTGLSGSNEQNQVATQVAEILSKSLRRVDVICRLDQNKYGIILPDTANNTYGIIAKRIFKYVQANYGRGPSCFFEHQRLNFS